MNYVHICSKALADALNIKKNELQKMPIDAQIDDLYTWHGHITKINGNLTRMFFDMEYTGHRWLEDEKITQKFTDCYKLQAELTLIEEKHNSNRYHLE